MINGRLVKLLPRVRAHLAAAAADSEARTAVLIDVQEQLTDAQAAALPADDLAALEALEALFPEAK